MHDRLMWIIRAWCFSASLVKITPRRSMRNARHNVGTPGASIIPATGYLQQRNRDRRRKRNCKGRRRQLTAGPKRVYRCATTISSHASSTCNYLYREGGSARNAALPLCPTRWCSPFPSQQISSSETKREIRATRCNEPRQRYEPPGQDDTFV